MDERLVARSWAVWVVTAHGTDTAPCKPSEIDGDGWVTQASSAGHSDSACSASNCFSSGAAGASSVQCTGTDRPSVCLVVCVCVCDQSVSSTHHPCACVPRQGHVYGVPSPARRQQLGVVHLLPCVWRLGGPSRVMNCPLTMRCDARISGL